MSKRTFTKDGQKVTTEKPGTAVNLLSQGWRETTRKAPAKPPEDDLESLTVDDLRDVAAQRDVDLTGTTKKAEIVKAITAAPQKS